MRQALLVLRLIWARAAAFLQESAHYFLSSYAEVIYNRLILIICQRQQSPVAGGKYQHAENAEDSVEQWGLRQTGVPCRNLVHRPTCPAQAITETVVAVTRGAPSPIDFLAHPPQRHASSQEDDLTWSSEI